jgi:hypothetical protein
MLTRKQRVRRDVDEDGEDVPFRSRRKQGYKLGGVSGKGWMPGRSGNPGGRPARLKVLREKAANYCDADVEYLHEIICDKEQPGATRVMAWCALRDTAYGKPPQALAISQQTHVTLQDITKDMTDEQAQKIYMDLITLGPEDYENVAAE